jgi:hypothetical protein
MTSKDTTAKKADTLQRQERLDPWDSVRTYSLFSLQLKNNYL